MEDEFKTYIETTGIVQIRKYLLFISFRKLWTIYFSKYLQLRGMDTLQIQKQIKDTALKSCVDKLMGCFKRGQAIGQVICQQQ